MILAAGRGVRMGALTERRPKPLLAIGAQTLIERHVHALVAAGITDLVVNLSYRGGQIRARLGSGARYGARIVYSEEGEPPLETGGGLLAALSLLGTEPFIVINADVVSDYPLGALARTSLAPTSVGHLVLVPNPAHHPEGDFGIGADGRATLARPFSTFAGISLLTPALFAECRPGRQPLKPILDRAIDGGHMTAEVYRGTWIDVGTPARLVEARNAVARA
jgi:N-acetyl-alpha-D-muramate 1-phosphate uridylyltransferase